jgi:2-aminoethylphosphonate-pyruvate transaminase
MNARTAVILAAGMGTRLKDRGRELPKGFLQLGEQPIIEESLARLARAGIERTVIVTGHLKQFYEELAARHGGGIETVHNPKYADSGSMYSLYLARERLDGDFLLLESDLIYEQRALAVVQQTVHPNLVLLSGTTRSGDEVYVETRNGRLVNMSKRRDKLGPNIAGELVGITRISRELFVAMQTFAETRFRNSLHVDYETDCLVGVAPAVPIHCEVIDDLLWSEIDDEAHYRRALERIYPLIRTRDAAG